MRAFEPGGAAAYLDGLQEGELERLIDDYAREEALYRQAVAFGVDDNDYVIKRRMIQSVEFITNILPFGLWISGEELHNNHHSDPRSARFHKRWFEIDMSWIYIRALAVLGLANSVRAGKPFT